MRREVESSLWIGKTGEKAEWKRGRSRAERSVEKKAESKRVVVTSDMLIVGLELVEGRRRCESAPTTELRRAARRWLWGGLLQQQQPPFGGAATGMCLACAAAGPGCH